jgi:hypothetical protein
MRISASFDPSHFHGLVAATVYPDACEADFVISSGNFFGFNSEVQNSAQNLQISSRNSELAGNSADFPRSYCP